MAIVYPDFLTISKLRVPPTEGEFFLLEYLSAHLDSSYEIFFNPFLDGDRPDIIILRKDHGAIIIEVKDWNLDLYSVSASNRWSVSTPSGKKQPVKSPHQQAYHYKSNMFDLHMPILGISEAINSSFWKVIHPFVYFHNSTEAAIKSLFNPAIAELTAQKRKLSDAASNGAIRGEAYNKRSDYLAKKIEKLERDIRISFPTDLLDKFIKKIAGFNKNKLFSEEIYEEFKRRLSPSEWTYSQGEKIEFDVTQQKYTKSVDELAKIKGVAGCGKTSIIAARSLDSYNRHGSVLILTFNITLKQLIRDKLSHINHHSPIKADVNKIEISSYHKFFLDQLNNIGIEIDIPESGKKDLDLFWDVLFKNISIFKNKDTIRYRSIFIDEIQDYEKEWITITRDIFLEPGGEMVLFGDHAQNIYQRDEMPLNKAIVKGFGSWRKLSKSYRVNTDSLLVFGFKQFQETFLQSRHEDLDILESRGQQGYLNADLVACQSYEESQQDDLAKKINSYIKEKKLVPNDVIIISSKIETLRIIESLFSNHEKTMTMFATNNDIEQLMMFSPRCKRVLDLHNYDIVKLQKIDEKTDDELYVVNALAKIERRKKNYFMQNSGLIKFSTIHSFKGMESKTVFCILHDTDNPEFIYTAITRAKVNLVIFSKKDNVYTDFFRNVYKTN